MPEDIALILREFRKRLEAVYGDRLVDLILFGSRARGDNDADSDIDVMVVLKGPVSTDSEIARTSDTRLDLCLRHGVVLSCLYVAEARLKMENSSLMIKMRREGLAV
jgi:predicted nucleotidyltransferase